MRKLTLIKIIRETKAWRESSDRLASAQRQFSNVIFDCRFNLFSIRVFSRVLFLVVSLLFSNIVFAQIVEVSSHAELVQALDDSGGGETIQLAAGNYGELTIHDYSFSSYVSIVSFDSNSPALFSNIDFKRSSYIRVDSVRVNHSGREGIGIFDSSHHIQVLNSEIYGQNQFDRNQPSYEQVSSLYAVNVNGDVHDILIENIDAHDVMSSAYLFSQVTDSVIRENKCDWVASDCYKFAGADGILFENNFGARNIHASPTAHVDFVQAQGAVSNSIFRGNVALISSSQRFQGLFFDDATFTNITFEDNIISTTSIRGISVSSPDNGPASSGIIARNNTILIPGGAFKASLILLPSGSIVEDNIVSSSVTKNEDRIGSNITLQWDDVDDIAHYDDYYFNADRGPGATINDFRPVSGAVSENQKGAFKRIFELIDGSSPPGTTPTGSVLDSKGQDISPVMLLLLDED